MSSTDHYGFSATKVFVWLFIFTAIEVLWGYMLPARDYGKLVGWGGLILWALCKGLLIAAYFMHLKFEGWIVKGLIAPTPFLIAVILIAVSPDISRNERMDHPIGSMYVESDGVVQDFMQHTSERPAPKVSEMHAASHADGDHGESEPAPEEASVAH